jgi:hypothetical protein
LCAKSLLVSNGGGGEKMKGLGGWEGVDGWLREDWIEGKIEGELEGIGFREQVNGD